MPDFACRKTSPSSVPATSRSAICLRVPLTTVSWSRDQQGKEAARLLLDRIGPDPSEKFQSVVIPPQLIVRRSSGGPA